jgi:hypothetical protein
MNIRTAILALIPLTIQAAPVLMPDGVNLDPNDPGINATVYAIPNSQWLVGWNDNPYRRDFDFNDFMFLVEFANGHGTATFTGATSALYNRAYLTNGMREIPRDEPLQFIADENGEVQFTLITGSGFRFDSVDHDSHMWAFMTNSNDVVSTPEASGFAMAVSALFVLGLIRWASGRRDNAECGQGWLQVSTPEALADTLAPILHWRVCNVWAWLTSHAPRFGFPTTPIAAAYGGDEAEEINARTGCMGCPLASRDVALAAVIKQPSWEYLAPLVDLRELYHELRFTRSFRLRKPGAEILKDGSLGHNPQRIGPLTMEARRYGLERIMDIQSRVNTEADRLLRPRVDILNEQERMRILELIEANTWPQKWDGSEPLGDELLDRVFGDGSAQPLLEIL